MKASAASRNHKVGIAAGVVAVVAMSATAGLAATIVGGVTPSVRPTGAPTVSAYPKGDQWLARARRGVSAPYPASLGFLADQGAWYTPFTVPGMPGRYDIRGLHQPVGKSGK